MKIPFNKAKEVLSTSKTNDERLESWNRFLPNLFEDEVDLLTKTVESEPETDELSDDEIKKEIEKLQAEKKDAEKIMMKYKKILWQLESRLCASERTYQCYLYCLKETLKGRGKI